MRLKPATLKKIIHGAIGPRPAGIGCDECWDQIDRFAELALTGKNAAEALPLLQGHLEHCPDCREEYEALLAALKNLPA